MSGNSIQSFGHLERLDPSTIDAMAHCSRIRKTSHTENRQRTENRQTEKAITEATLIPWIAGLSGPIDRTFFDFKMAP